MGKKRNQAVEPKLAEMITEMTTQISNLASGSSIPKRGTVQDALYERVFLLTKIIGSVEV